MDFDALYDDVFPALFRYLTRLTGDSDAAEDVAQEAFVRLLEHEVQGPPPALRVWLFRTGTHLVRDRWRVGSNRQRLLEIHPVTPAATPDPHEALEREEAVAGVRRALEALDGRDRELLLMREEGFSYQEMAAAVGVQASSVGTLLARARKRFETVMDTAGGR